MMISLEAIWLVRNFRMIDMSELWIVRSSPPKWLNRISWNFEVIMDILCRYVYLQEILIQFFMGIMPFCTYKYAGFELRQGYFPLLVHFCKWGEKGECLRKWWDRCCTRHIVKSYFFYIFFNEYPSFIEFNFEYVYKIKCHTCIILYPYRVILKLRR